MSTQPEWNRAYGCVRCQDYHYEGEPTFEAHLYFQSKHGIERRPHYDVERFERIVKANEVKS